MLLTRTEFSSFVPFSLPAVSGVTLPIYQAPTSQVCPRLCCSPLLLKLFPPNPHAASSIPPARHLIPLAVPFLGRSPLVLTSSRDVSHETSETKRAAPIGGGEGFLRRAPRTCSLLQGAWPGQGIAGCEKIRSSQGKQTKKFLVRSPVLMQQHERNVITA